MRAAADAAVRAMVERRRTIAGLSPENGAPSAGTLDAAEDAVEAAQAALAEAERRRAAIAAGNDPASQEAMRALEAAIGARSLRTLREDASRTPTREDDAIVARLEIAAAERAQVERALADAQAQAGAARTRLQEVQALRHDMRGRGVERSEWGFASGAMVGVLIGEVLRGALSARRVLGPDGAEPAPLVRSLGRWGGKSQPGPWNKTLPGPWDRHRLGPGWRRRMGG